MGRMSPSSSYVPGFLAIHGRAIAPGLACGPLRRNRPDLAAADAHGCILLAERAVPDDVGRILASAGTLTMSGAVLSHVSLLSREFGKASVAFSGITPAHLSRDGEEGVLILDDVVGGATRAAIDEGDILFLDGTGGVIGIPGGVDRAARRAVRRLHATLVAYAATPDDETHVRALVEEAAAADEAAFAFLLEAALVYRVVPPGFPSRRLLAALAAGTGRPGYETRIAGLLERVLADAALRCDRARDALADVDDLEELQRALRTLETALERDLRLVEDLGGDPDRLERHLEAVLAVAAARRATLELSLREELRAAINLTDEALRAKLGGLFRLLRRARGAGTPGDEFAQLHARLSRQLAEERARAGTLLVVPLISGARADRQLVGGKAASLLEVLRTLPAGCRTPRGFAVTSASYRLHLLGEIGEKLRLAAEADDEASTSRLARAAILSGEVPEEVREAVADAFEALGATRLAVRSSATIEDGPLGSLAGLFDTYLGVHGYRDLMDRVRWIWASLWNARALAALAATGLSPLRASQAVLVQELIDTTSAGVLLSRDPGGRPDTLLINATWGLGEGISQGDVSGDLYWVRRSSGDVLESEPGATSSRIELAAEGMGTVEVPLGPEWSDRRCLNPSQLARLADLARTLEAATGRAQDVEFGFDRNDELVVFQLRRIVPRRAA
jgi:pyruvate,water dikinase